jgi:hypothetical protein
MGIFSVLFDKIISLLWLFRLLIAYTGEKIGFNGPADAPESPLKTNGS